MMHLLQKLEESLKVSLLVQCSTVEVLSPSGIYKRRFRNFDYRRNFSRDENHDPGLYQSHQTNIHIVVSRVSVVLVHRCVP